MSAFFLFDMLELVNEAKMNQYRAKVFANVEEFGGKYRIVGGDQDVVEGDWRLNFPVMIEFENKRAALAWYESPEYAEIKKLRLAASRCNGVLIDGDVMPLGQ